MRIKTIFLMLVFSALASCGMYLSDTDSDNTSKLSPLAIRGGGFLSTDKFNEITPFIFVDPATSNRTLFFASDRDGTFDLFYATMYDDGTFDTPVKHPASLANSNATEFSPVVYFSVSSITALNDNTNYYFIYILIVDNSTNGRWITSGNFTDLLTNKQLVEGELSSAKRFGIVYNTNGISMFLALFEQDSTQPVLMTNDGAWNSSYDITFNNRNQPLLNGTSFIFNANTYSSLTTGSAINGLFSTTNKESNTCLVFYMENTFFDSKINLTLTLTNFFQPASYVNKYNDCDPSVDPFDYRVYFSSDRTGTFDLYRYNLNTFKKVSEYPAIITNTNCRVNPQ